MNFIETMVGIAERGEKVITERAFSVYTDKFVYYRQNDGSWEQKPLPPPVDNSVEFPPLLEEALLKEVAAKKKANK